MTSKPRKNAHKALLRDVSRLINQPVDSLATRFVALAKLKLDATEAQLLAGDPSVTVADLRALEEILSAHVPRPGLQITVKYAEPADAAPADHAAVDGLVECRRCHWRPADKDRVSRCYRCGWTHGADFDSPWTPLIAPADTSPVAPSLSPQNAPAGSPSPANVIPLDAEQRKAELRAASRVSNGVDPGPPRPHYPNIGSPFSGGDNRSISQWQRDCDAAYRVT
jgi:hypothetical protein